jgi:GT2 family glycosyltransferase
MINIILPVHGRIDATRKFLKALYSQSISFSYLVYLVDDTIDGSSIEEFKDFKNIIFLKGNGNLYWGGAINYALELIHLRSSLDNEIVVFANNDIEFNSNTFSACINILIREQVSILHPLTVDNNGNRLSCGKRIISWFPYMTREPIFHNDLGRVDLASARLLFIKGFVFKKVPFINYNLPHYLGDNNFVLESSKYGFNCFITNLVTVIVDENLTGNKIYNIKSFNDFKKSLKDIKSPNCIEYRKNFVSLHKSKFLINTIVFGMTIKSFLGWVYYKIKFFSIY